VIPISRPHLGEAEQRAVEQALASGWVAQGARVEAFERGFAAFCGVEHAVASTSCTTALHLAVAGLGAGPGDEVVVPAFTWIATANAVAYTGATPVFCDVSLDTLNLDPGAMAAAVTERTVGLLPVHLFGLAADMGAVAAIAGRHGLWVLEDAACAVGTRQGGRHAGTFGDAGCFSFHPRKTLTTGEGGMLVTGDGALAARARSLRDHGSSRSGHQRHVAPRAYELADHDVLGFNYRMTDVQAAIGCAQLERADWLLGERARVAARYDEGLAGLEWLRTPSVPEGETHGWQSYVCLTRGIDRDALMAALEDQGIATRPGTHAPPEMGVYRREGGEFPNAHLAARHSIALPLYAGLGDAEQDRVIEALLTAQPSRT
jgi:dTDP-4-amino-4,6-dideoxygalactose transaminase